VASLNPRGKTPITPRGFKDATRDERRILHWWDANPDANIGVACIELVVLDIDAKHGADPREVLANVDTAGAPIIRTGEAPDRSDEWPNSLPGVRGAHVFFSGEHKTTDRLKIRGVEIRGSGAFVVVPPSVHPSGVPYDGDIPSLDALPAVPGWLLGLVESNGTGAAPAVGARIEHGRQHDELVSLAGSMRARGMNADEIYAALKVVNQTRCEVPGPDENIRRIADSVAKYSPKAKREPSDLSDLVIPDHLLEELENAGVSEADIAGAGSLKDLMKLLGGKESVATKIVKLVEELGVELFHDSADRCFATFTVGHHSETWPVSSQSFKRHVRRSFYERYETAPNGQSIADAVGVLDSKAQFEGPELDVSFRVAGDAQRIVIDLGDAAWRAIEITRSGWKVLDTHPVKFRRSGAMQALPIPVPGGDIDRLRPFVNVGDDDAWRLVVGWLLAALRPGFPYPVLIAHGEQGSAKSTLGRVLRALVDPNVSALRVAPHDVDDLMVSATSSWVVAYDNVSRIPPSLSDALCRLSTGGGLSKRQLYTDQDEVLLDATRPIVINGIEEAAHRGDLLDRALLIEMPLIPESQRQPEDKFWSSFAGVHAEVLGGICDALAAALAHVASVRLDRLPRMADFAKWVAAAEPALGWEPGAFMHSYAGNRTEAHEVAIDSSVIGPALLKVAAAGFKGTASELLDRLEDRAGEKAARSKDWPKSGRALSSELTRLTPNLRHLGYGVDRSREPDAGRRRLVEIIPPATREEEAWVA